MRFLRNFLIIILLGLPVTGVAKSYTKDDLCGCYQTENSNIILNLSSDGTFSIKLYSPNDILIGKWEVQKRTIILNCTSSPRDSITVYHVILSDKGFTSGRKTLIKDDFTYKPLYYFQQKEIKIININKLFYGHSVKKKRHSIKFKKGPKINLIRDVNHTKDVNA